MKISYFLAALLLIGAGFSSCSDSIDDVIRKNFEARGGNDITSIKNISYMATATSSSVRISFQLIIQFPDKLRYELEFAGNKTVTIMNGNKGWSIDSLAREIPDYQLKTFKETIDYQKRFFDTELMNYKEKGSELLLFEDDTLNGEDVYRITLRLKDSSEVIFYLDENSYLEKKSVATSILMGRKLEQIVYYSDYKNVDGYVIPHKWTYKMIKNSEGNAVTQEVIYSNIKINRDLSDTLFAKPKYVIKPSITKE